MKLLRKLTLPALYHDAASRMYRQCAGVALALATGLGMQASCLGAETKSEAESVAADLANPLAPITSFAAQFRTEFGNGPDDDVNYQLRLQPTLFKPLASDSAFLLRSIVPISFKNWPDDTGLSDITLIPYYVPDVTKEVFVGYGASIGIPTATEYALGSGKWTAGPAMIIARPGKPITYGGLVQHIESYAGNSNRGDIRVTTLQPFSTYLFGGGWSASLNVEASYNWNADGEKWTIPVAASLSKVVNFGGKYVNIGMGVVSYVKKPAFAPDSELRLNVTYVLR